MVGKRGGEKLDVFRRFNRQTGGRRAVGKFIEGLGEPGAVRTRECRLSAGLSRQRCKHFAMLSGDLAERVRLFGHTLQRRQGVGELPYEVFGGREFVVPQSAARIGTVQIGLFGVPESAQRVRQAGAAGIWARPTENGALQRGDGARAIARAEAQQWMLEQGEQWDRR